MAVNEGAPDLAPRPAWLKDRKITQARSVYLEGRRVRCGKRPCRCRRGELHGPFYYLRFVGRPGPKGKRVRVYVRQSVLAEVRAWLAQRAEDRWACRMISRLCRYRGLAS